MSSDRFGACVAKAPPVRESCGFDKVLLLAFPTRKSAGRTAREPFTAASSIAYLRPSGEIKLNPGKFLTHLIDNSLTITSSPVCKAPRDEKLTNSLLSNIFLHPENACLD
jgi:hypothetical protein